MTHFALQLSAVRKDFRQEGGVILLAVRAIVIVGIFLPSHLGEVASRETPGL